MVAFATMIILWFGNKAESPLRREILIMITVIEFDNNYLEDVAVNVTELCDAICEADLGIVTATGSDFHVCELRGIKFQSYHELATHCELNIMDFSSFV